VLDNIENPTPLVQITRFRKIGGNITKTISLDNGKVVSDGSPCKMSDGFADRTPLSGVHDLADLLSSLKPNEAIALGRLRKDLPAVAKVVTKAELPNYPEGAISRTADYIGYATGQPAFVLIDYDRKAMTSDVTARLDGVGGAYGALLLVCLEIMNAASVGRKSTSANLFNGDQEIKGSGGGHLYLLVQDGSDIVRFLKALHDRCWLAGFGWFMIGAGGDLLERSIIDRMVGAPERLIFEGAPEIVPPLSQGPRDPVVEDGVALDTRAACPDLTPVELARLADMKLAAAQEFKSECERVRAAWVARRVDATVARFRVTPLVARGIVEKALGGILLPHTVLPFDDSSLEGCTVADVLKDPQRFIGETLADPIEGVPYGTGKGKILAGRDGGLRIHSFAHGSRNYDLRYDMNAVLFACLTAGRRGGGASAAADLLCRMIQFADLADTEEQEIIDCLANEYGSKQAIKSQLKEAKKAHADKAKRDKVESYVASRHDTRIKLTAPFADERHTEVVESLDEVLSTVDCPEPPMRDIENNPIQVIVRKPLGFHTLRSVGDDVALGDTPIPAPDMALLTKLDVHTMRLVIERYICHMSVDEIPRPVTLAADFIRSYMSNSKSRLPIVGSIVTTPVVKKDGSLLAPNGLDRESGVVFRIDQALRDLLPRREDCTPDAVREAMRFLTDEWLCDVTTDYAGKCTLIALALTLIQRGLLPARPGFIVTAGQRGGGKTTAINMVVLAVSGREAAAVAWSNDPEERRKSMLAHLGEGVSEIVYDNMSRGYLINCPHIDKVLTGETHTDRILGESEKRTVSTKAVFIWTGNNIGAKGDTVSRTLPVRIETDRPDPENRPFKHPDPIGWTRSNRGAVLRALYTLLMGNQRHETNKPQGRFKEWWHLVGAPVEYAASLIGGEAVSFGDMWLDAEAGDEEVSDTTDLISALQRWKPGLERFTSADLAGVLNDVWGSGIDAETRRILREQLIPGSNAKTGNSTVSARTLTLTLHSKTDSPVKIGDQIWMLKEKFNKKEKVWHFCLYSRDAIVP
jgi:hypothetical protein